MIPRNPAWKAYYKASSEATRKFWRYDELQRIANEINERRIKKARGKR